MSENNNQRRGDIYTRRVLKTIHKGVLTGAYDLREPDLQQRESRPPDIILPGIEATFIQLSRDPVLLQQALDAATEVYINQYRIGRIAPADLDSQIQQLNDKVTGLKLGLSVPGEIKTTKREAHKFIKDAHRLHGMNMQKNGTPPENTEA